jgi:hypothetical protein
VDGVFPLVALAEGKNASGLALVRTGSGSAPKPTVRPDELDGVIKTASQLRAADDVRLNEKKHDRCWSAAASPTPSVPAAPSSPGSRSSPPPHWSPGSPAARPCSWAGGSLLGSVHLQHVCGFSPLTTGLLFLPVAVATGLGAHLSSRLVGRIGSHAVAVAGMAIAAAGSLPLTRQAGVLSLSDSRET